MAAKERRCRQVTAGASLSPGDTNSAKKDHKPRNRGTGPKLFSKAVTRELLQGQFHLPMEQAGKIWGVSTTIVKRVCRAFGIERWPYRQIQSARKRIDKLEEKLEAGGRNAAEREKIKEDIRTLEAKVDDLLINPNPHHNRPKSDVDSPHPLPLGCVPPSPRSIPLAARKSAGYKASGVRGTGAVNQKGLGGCGGGGGGGRKRGEADMPEEAGKPVLGGLALACGAARSGYRKNNSKATARALGASSAAAIAAVVERRSRPSQQGQQGQRGQRGKQGTKRPATAAFTPIPSTFPMATVAAKSGGSLRNHKRARTGGRKSITASPPDAAALAAKVSYGSVKIEQEGALVGLTQETSGRVASVAAIMSPLMELQVITTPPPACSGDVARLGKNSVGGVVGGGNAEVGCTRTPIAFSGTSPGRDGMGCEDTGSSQTLETAKSVGIDWAADHAEGGWPGAGVERVCIGTWTPPMTAQHIGAGALQEPSGKLQAGGGGTGRVGSRANSCTSEATADLSGADEESPSPFFAPDQQARVTSGGILAPDQPARGNLGAEAGRAAGGDVEHESVDATGGGQAGAAGLDDFGLESPLMLDITAACNSGSGSTSSSWPPLSVGSYLNTEEAFTAFANSPCDFVPGGW